MSSNESEEDESLEIGDGDYVEDFSSEEEILEEVDDRWMGNIPTVPSTSHVSTSVKRKIVEGKYFVMKKLLPSLEDDLDGEGEKKMTYEQWSNIEDRRRLSDGRKGRDLNFYEWIRCFHTFMSIRLEHSPMELQGLLRHAEIVQDLHSAGKDAIRYDAQFRRFKEQHPKLRWGEYLAEVVIKLPSIRPSWNQRSFSKARPTVNDYNNGWGNYNNRFTGRAGPNSIGFTNDRICFKFNSALGCKRINCLFQHKCRNCGVMGHPAARCMSRRGQ